MPDDCRGECAEDPGPCDGRMKDAFHHVERPDTCDKGLPGDSDQHYDTDEHRERLYPEQLILEICAGKKRGHSTATA
ncbi:hypothetical protein ES703_120383 [subsurface metagenome]